jgi:hypothetical protein
MELFVEHEAEEESTLSNSEQRAIALKRKQYKKNQKLKREIKDLTEVQHLLRLEKHLSLDANRFARSIKLNSKAIRERLLAYAFLRGRSWQSTEETHLSDLPELKSILHFIGKFYAGPESHIPELSSRLREWVPAREEFKP